MSTMDRITNAALIGSARAPVDETLAPATPEGGLVGSLADVNPEQRLLLAAGVRAIYRMAGYTPERLDAPLKPPKTNINRGSFIRSRHIASKRDKAEISNVHS